MDKKLSRIASFIESLPVDESMEDCQFAVLPTEMSHVGSGDNGGNCENYQLKQCNESKNGGNCVNHGVCGKSKNDGDCKNYLNPSPTDRCRVDF